MGVLLDFYEAVNNQGGAMQTIKLIDRTARVVAFVHAPMGAIVGLPLAILGALMAPTFASSIESAMVVVIAVTIVVWVMISCLKPDTIAPRLLRGRRLRFIMIRVPIYLFALAGIAWWASYSYLRWKT
jgi:hypothetical protein